jgi:hypothetical protein
MILWAILGAAIGALVGVAALATGYVLRYMWGR